MSQPVVREESSLASQCMEFCQALSSQGKAFSFSMKIGDSFSFSLDTKEKAPAPQARKVSPSTQMRNDLRRQKYLASKTKIQNEALEAAADIPVSKKCSVTCDICGHKTWTDKGMKLHKRNKHELSQIDGNTSIVEPQLEEETQRSTESKTKEEDHVILKMQENGFARLEMKTEETPPPKVFHQKHGIGTNPKYAKFKDKNCVEYTFKAGNFYIEVFPIK